jgi:glycosyltransferase involved in cell wall biosynthesis
MIRIRYDNQIFLQQEYGGISRYFVELIARLGADDRCSVEVGRWMSINRYRIDAAAIQVDGRPSCVWPRGDRFRLMAGRFLDTYCLQSSAADILHCTYFRLPPATRARIVATVYDCIPEIFPQQPEDPTIVRKRLQAHRADLVICISQTTADDLVRIHSIPRERIQVIHLASSIAEVPDANSLNTRPYLLHVGNRGGYKNFGILKAAYERDPAIYDHFDLLCFGGTPFSESEIPAHGRIRRLTGGDAILATLYKHAVALVYPSLYEGFGIPPLEAWQYGCPVIHCGGGAIPEVVGDAGLLLDGRDVEAFGAGLRRALTDTDMLQQLVARGYKRREQYSWERCAAAHLSAYESLK